MKKKRAIVLGGGISGLSLAWYLSKKPDLEVALLEKSSRVGGCIQTDTSGGFLFEKGPRTFRSTSSADLLELIEDLGLKEELIQSDSSARRRFLWMKGTLRPVINGVTLLPLIAGLWREWRIPPMVDADESVWDFAARRFNSKIADRIFDPLTLGIHAGDAKTLSMDACFPSIKRWEREYGSITKAFFKKKSGTKPHLFTIKSGVERLVQTLAESMENQILLNEEVKELRFPGEGVEVVTNSNTYAADVCYSALPPNILSGLIEPHHSDLGKLLANIPMQPISVVNVAFERTSYIPSAFGYLIPSSEKQKALGVVFDSMIFPEQNQVSTEVRLTVMLKEGGRREALAAIAEQLQVLETPAWMDERSYFIPQLLVGHPTKMANVLALLNDTFPQLKLAGNFIEGVSVNDCIRRAKKVSDGLY